jgi:hypothetical protein
MGILNRRIAHISAMRKRPTLSLKASNGRMAGLPTLWRGRVDVQTGHLVSPRHGLMPKERPSRPKKTQHEKFVDLAREVGADESEGAFVRKLRKIAKPQLKPFEEERQLRLPFGDPRTGD